MKPEEKVSYLKALMYIALADDNIDQSELECFNQLGTLYGLSANELDEIKDTVVEKKETLESIIKGITERQTKLSLIYELLAICYADNNYSESEKAGMLEICDLLNVESDKLKALEEVMEENVALQKKVNIILERGDRG